MCGGIDKVLMQKMCFLFVKNSRSIFLYSEVFFALKKISYVRKKLEYSIVML